MNSVFSWKETIQSVFMVLPPPGVARQGFVTSTMWQEICSRKDRPIFPLLPEAYDLPTNPSYSLLEAYDLPTKPSDSLTEAYDLPTKPSDSLPEAYDLPTKPSD